MSRKKSLLLDRSACMKYNCAGRQERSSHRRTVGQHRTDRLMTDASMRQIMANPHFVQIVSLISWAWHSPSW